MASARATDDQREIIISRRWIELRIDRVIENGFVYLPATADWLAPYLHELSTFPNGKHDDQADSTSQALDWFKQGHIGPGMGFYHFIRQEYETLMTRQNLKGHELARGPQRAPLLRSLGWSLAS